APQVPVVDPIGAGDSMVAALSAGLYENLGWPELLARAIAAGSTDVTTFGGGLIQPDTFARLRQEVTVSPLGPAWWGAGLETAPGGQTLAQGACSHHGWYVPGGRIPGR